MFSIARSIGRRARGHSIVSPLWMGRVSKAPKHVSVMLFTIMSLVAVEAFGIGAEPARKPMRESASVVSDANVQKRLGAVEDFIADKRWAEAIDVLYEIAQSEGRSLVLAQPGEAGGSAVYVNVGTRCQVLLSQLPAEGREVFRRKVDPQAKRWWENWQRTRDESELERIVRQAYLSSYGDDALWALGEAAWDRGDFASARLYWTQLVPLNETARAAKLPTVLRFPDSDFDIASVLARLVLCTLMEGHHERAIDQQQQFAEMHPEVKGVLGGREGVLSDLLKQIIVESESWAKSHYSAEQTTFGISSERTRILPSIIDVGPSRWHQPLSSAPIHVPPRFRETPDRGPLSTHPVVDGDIVFVNDSNSIRAFNLLTGQPAWPNEGNSAVIYQSAESDTPIFPDRACVGVPWNTMSIADGRLFARMGSPVTSTAEGELRDLPCDLICLDIAQGQGRLVWKVSFDDLPHDGSRQWRFEGSPLVVDGHAYVLHSRRSPQLEFAVTCFDAASGQRLWTRSLATARPNLPDSLNRVSHLLLTSGAGRLFVSTDAGAVVALDAKDGRIEWALTYEGRSLEDESEIVDAARHGLVPPMFYEGMIFVVPNDSDRLFCIEAGSGRVLWQRQRPRGERWRHLLGVARGGVHGVLVVSGISLWGLDVETGRDVWKIRPSESVERGYGRGVLCGNVVFWPTRESIVVVEAASGQPQRNIPLSTETEAETGGNIVVSGGMLLVAQSDQLVAYGDYSLLKERLHRELSNSDDKTELLLKLVEIEASAGKIDDALKSLEIARGLIDTEEQSRTELNDGTGSGRAAALRRASLSRVREMLRRAGLQKLGEDDAETASKSFHAAMSLATQPSDRVNLLFDLADSDVQRDQIESALAHWQTILEDDQLRSVLRHESNPQSITTAGEEAREAMDQMIAIRGRSHYSSIEARAAIEIKQLRDAGDAAGLSRALMRYPHSAASESARLDVARLQRKANNIAAAAASFSRLAESAANPDQRALALFEWAEMLQHAGYLRASLRVWQELEKAPISALVPTDVGKEPAHEVATKRMSHADFLKYRNSSLAKPVYLERAWETWFRPGSASPNSEADALTNGNHKGPIARNHVLVPEGDAPSHSMACVLIFESGPTELQLAGELKCLDRGTGVARWSIPMNRVPVWAAYGDTHLIVATLSHIAAVRLESGAILWTTPTQDSNATPRSDHAEFQLRWPWIVGFDSVSGLILLDGHSGEIQWRYLPRGRLQSKWACGENQIVLQTLRPDVFLLIDINRDRNIVEIPGANQVWRCNPLVDGESRIVQVSNTRSIESISGSTSLPLWKFAGGMSFAHVDPVIWRHHGKLLATIDGTTLTRIDEESGEPMWSNGIADAPHGEPLRQVVGNRDQAFAASRGMLRSVALADGTTKWERFVGGDADQWNVIVSEGLVGAWPSESPTSIVWCDASTGRVVQRTHLPRVMQRIQITSDGHGSLVYSDQGILALKPRD